MHAETVTPLSARLAQPLNESIRQENPGQFALMLSLLYEARLQPLFAPVQVGDPGATKATAVVPAERSFNLEMQLNVALSGNSPAQANLLRSVLMERTEQMIAALAPALPVALADAKAGPPLRRGGDALVAQIEHARQHGLGRPPAVANL